MSFVYPILGFAESGSALRPKGLEATTLSKAMAPLLIFALKHGGSMSGFNIFSTGGAVPHGFFAAQTGLPAMAQGRANHAKMLAHAATRRRAAQTRSEDTAYWKACAPIAVKRAIAIRCDAGLAKLP